MDCTASWCAPCQAIKPYFHELRASGLYPGIDFVQVDVDEAEAIADFVKVTAMPTFKVFKSGECLETLTSSCKEALDALLKSYSQK